MPGFTGLTQDVPPSPTVPPLLLLLLPASSEPPSSPLDPLLLLLDELLPLLDEPLEPVPPPSSPPPLLLPLVLLEDPLPELETPPLLEVDELPPPGDPDSVGEFESPQAARPAARMEARAKMDARQGRATVSFGSSLEAVRMAYLDGLRMPRAQGSAASRTA
jgi:hypothetical protein